MTLSRRIFDVHDDDTVSLSPAAAMASLFDSFRNSSMPKRLLRYALSRFDVLDADALDLDNLDLAWGMKTVLEFRDVGLRVKVSCRQDMPAGL